MRTRHKHREGASALQNGGNAGLDWSRESPGAPRRAAALAARGAARLASRGDTRVFIRSDGACDGAKRAASEVQLHSGRRPCIWKRRRPRPSAPDHRSRQTTRRAGRSQQVPRRVDCLACVVSAGYAFSSMTSANPGRYPQYRSCASCFGSRNLETPHRHTHPHRPCWPTPYMLKQYRRSARVAR